MVKVATSSSPRQGVRTLSAVRIPRWPLRWRRTVPGRAWHSPATGCRRKAIPSSILHAFQTRLHLPQFQPKLAPDSPSTQLKPSSVIFASTVGTRKPYVKVTEFTWHGVAQLLRRSVRTCRWVTHRDSPAPQNLHIKSVHNDMVSEQTNHAFCSVHVFNVTATVTGGCWCNKG